MKLDRVVIVNWGQMRPGDYEFGNMTLLTGPTGAGKSTMLDGIQTIMTAAYQGIVAYNPGQEEVQQGQRRGKSKRTLESFIVGAEYSRFSRPDGAHGFLAGVFRPDAGESSARMFTAVVAAAAHVDGAGERREPKLERLELLIVEDAALSVSDFLRDVEQSEWVAVDNIVRHLKSSYAKVLPFDNHKKDYLSALYGRLRGRTGVTWDEAQNAARAWSQSIAYRPIGSVHELVREDILEFDGKLLQESIGRISGLMRRVTSLKEEGRRLAATVARLKELRTLISQTSETFEEQVQYDLLLAKLQFAADEAEAARRRREMTDQNEQIRRFNEQEQTAIHLRRTADQKRLNVNTKLSGMKAHTQKEALDDQLSVANATARQTLTALHAGLRGAAQLASTAQMLLERQLPDGLTKLKAALETLGPALAYADMQRLGDLMDAVVAANQDEDLSVHKLLQVSSAFDGAENGLDELYARLAGPEDSVLVALVAEAVRLEQRTKDAESNRTDLASKKQRLAAGGGNYDRATVQALERIREELPEAGVQVLCDLVEPVSPKWQQAIEGYLDNARFNLIVHPDLERRTIDFLHSWGSRSKVVQGKSCLERADDARVPADSIIHELRTDNPIAKAYLVEQYGPVVKVENSDKLRFTPRGLTIEGKGSGSRTMFVGDRKALVLGRLARERALADTTQEIEDLDKDLEDLKKLAESLTSLRRAVSGAKQVGFDPQPLVKAATDMDVARQALASLDLTEVEGLREQLQQFTAEYNEQENAISACQAGVLLAKKAIETAESAISVLDGRKDERLREVQKQIGRLKAVCEQNTQKTFTVLSQQVSDLLESGRVSALNAQAHLNATRSKPHTLLGDLREMVAEYNTNVRQDERFQSALPHLHTTEFDPFYGPLVMLGRSVTAMHDDLDAIGLYQNRQKVEEAEKSFHDVFTKQFCVEIKSKVDDGVRTLRRLNTELERLKFGTDRFSIDYSKWEPEFQDYYSFFSAAAELADSPESVDLFETTELSPKHVQVRDHLAKLLLDDDQERASRELLRIADYRNYRRYEIWNDSDSGGRIALSTWGTGSGGQLETPAYIVRAAVVTNRLKLFDKGASLKMLVSDESFSRMDEARARAVLKYLRDSLNIQVVSAMPTRGAGGLRPEFDREFSFSRVAVDENGELDFIIECDERVFKQDKMRELWETQRKAAREQARIDFEASEGTQKEVAS